MEVNVELVLVEVRKLSTELRGLMEAKRYSEAGPTFRALRAMCSMAKIGLLDAMLATSAVAGRNIAREKHLQVAGEAAIKAAEAEADYTATMAARARIFGRLGGRLLGWVGLVLLAQDGVNMAMSGLESMARTRTLETIACYGDYVEEYANGELGPLHGKFKDYDQWYASEYLPPLHQRQKEFWRHFRILFPHGTAV